MTIDPMTDPTGRPHVPNDDQVSTGELARMIGLMREDLRDVRREINARLDVTVTVDTFNRERGRVDGRFKDLGTDIAEVRSERKESAATIVARMDRSDMWLRWMAAAIVLPILLFIGSIALTLSPPTVR